MRTNQLAFGDAADMATAQALNLYVTRHNFRSRSESRISSLIRGLRRGGLLGRRETSRGSVVLATCSVIDAEVHPARVDRLEHSFSRSESGPSGCRTARRLPANRPAGQRGLDFARHDSAKLCCDFIRADIEPSDDATRRPSRPGQQRRHLASMSFVATIVAFRRSDCSKLGVCRPGRRAGRKGNSRRTRRRARQRPATPSRESLAPAGTGR